MDSENTPENLSNVPARFRAIWKAEQRMASELIERGVVSSRVVEEAIGAVRSSMQEGKLLRLGHYLFDGNHLKRIDYFRLAAEIRSKDRDLPVDLGAECFESATIGSYEVLEEIGRGGMGVVYRVRNSDTGEIAAVKIVRPVGARERETIRRFQREVKVIGSIDHPHVVRLIESGSCDGQEYCVMEILEGPSFGEALETCDLMTMVRLVSEVARGLAEVHRQGVIHRDLKPSNILLDKEGHPRITDFGVAFGEQDVDDSRLTETGIIIGTSRYLAPERIYGDAEEVDHRVDIYSMGVILFQVLGGTYPHAEEDTMQLYQAILAGEIDWIRLDSLGVPRDLVAIVSHCLERNPDDRYADADALADDLDRFLRGENSVEPARRRKPEMLSIGVVLLVAVLTLMLIVLGLMF
ncbi:MAG: serine/threonine-protein kinase [Planctomycetota bacterium]|nr:serine/threonine-protein kinase [Planctomycetota bacterium]